MPPQKKPGRWSRWKSRLGERLKVWLERLLHPESLLPIWVASVCALFVLAILVTLYVTIPELRPEYWAGAYVEATGFLFDLLFFGVALAIIIHWRDRKHTIQRYQEEIQDFKRWNTEEGRLRIAGAIRRLERLGKTDIDFRGMKLSDFSFKENDINSIRGSVFYEGEWGTLSSREEVDLKNVDFSFVNCSEVVFSRFNPFEGFNFPTPVRITNCSFRESSLRNALFNAAFMEWTEPPPDTIGEVVEHPGEPPHFMQIVYPPFNGADLTGASFRNAQFRNADFRKAEGILEADFSGAQGLETCAFDDESVKAAVLRMATEGASQ